MKTQQLERTITSMEVACMVEKSHNDVLKDIRRIVGHLGEGKSSQSYFIESTYVNSQNKELPSFLLTKKGCELYGTRMTGEKGTLFAIEYIERFNEMETTVKQQALPTDPMEILQLTFDAQKQTNERVGGLEIKFGLIENSLEEVKTEICLSRNQKFQLASKVRSNAMKAVGGKRSNAYKELYKTAIAEHWREIKNYFDVNSYEEIPKLRFEEAMELADEWTPSMELKMRIKKANTYVAI